MVKIDGTWMASVIQTTKERFTVSTISATQRAVGLIGYLDPAARLTDSQLSQCRTVAQAWRLIKPKRHHLQLDLSQPELWAPTPIGPLQCGYIGVDYRGNSQAQVNELAIAFKRSTGEGSLWLDEWGALKLCLSTGQHHADPNFSQPGQIVLSLEAAADGTINKLEVDPDLVVAGCCIMDMVEHLDYGLQGWLRHILQLAPAQTVVGSHSRWLLALMQG